MCVCMGGGVGAACHSMPVTVRGQSSGVCTPSSVGLETELGLSVRCEGQHFHLLRHFPGLMNKSGEAKFEVFSWKWLCWNGYLVLLRTR